MTRGLYNTARERANEHHRQVKQQIHDQVQTVERPIPRAIGAPTLRAPARRPDTAARMEHHTVAVAALALEAVGRLRATS